MGSQGRRSDISAMAIVNACPRWSATYLPSRVVGGGLDLMSGEMYICTGLLGSTTGFCDAGGVIGFGEAGFVSVNENLNISCFSNTLLHQQYGDLFYLRVAIIHALHYCREKSEYLFQCYSYKLGVVFDTRTNA